MMSSSPASPNTFPARQALSQAEIDALWAAVSYYTANGVDPGYQGIYEKRYTDAFCAYMGGGYADAVCTGSVALYVAIRALNLRPGTQVLVSPITDPGTLAAIIFNNLIPRLMDSAPDSYNIGAEQFLERRHRDVSAAVIVHAIGHPVHEIGKICQSAQTFGVKVVEDCSQAHGAKVAGKPVGSFGDVACFSTMYRKAHMTGGSGGIIWTKDLELYRQVLAHADRGKPRWEPGFNDRDPRGYLFPALNFHTDELSCAIGAASLARLNDTILARLAWVAEFTGRLRDKSKCCRPYGYTPNDSPFIYPVIVDRSLLTVRKREFAEAVLAQGIPLNPHYGYLVADWPWIQNYLADDFDTPNAWIIIERSFCLYLNERYGTKEAARCVKAILEAERCYGRP